MATANHPTFQSYDRASPILNDNPPSSTENQRVGSAHGAMIGPFPGQHLDDADILAWKRQFANFDLRNASALSNSAEDLTQLDDQYPYQPTQFSLNYHDMDEEDFHFEDPVAYDYQSVIQDRLKRANQELEHDETPSELKHHQRVSFDAVVRAVDIEHDSQEHETVDTPSRPTVPVVAEEPTSDASDSKQEPHPHQYTVPLNDTQAREGPTLLETLRARQFHGITPTGEPWSIPRAHVIHAPDQDKKTESAAAPPVSESSTRRSPDSSATQGTMLVSINGGFELQSADDYIARRQATTEPIEKEHKQDTDRDRTSSPRVTILDSMKQEPKENGTSPRTAAPQRSTLPPVRPKSSSTSRSNPDDKNQARPKSANLARMSTISYLRAPSGVDFDERNRKAAEKKRAEQMEERRRQEEAEKRKKENAAKAKEMFDHWIAEKDKERKRAIEEKRIEQEERETREKACSKELAELREKKFQEWLERKNRESMMINEFRKLQAHEEDETVSGGSSSTINQNQRAFQRWLRRKYEQSREEKRQKRREERLLRRRQRRSIKRFQLQQDLQLAKSFGYS